MRFSLLILVYFLINSCHAQTQSSAPPDLESLKWNLRDALKMQLPLTYPEQQRGREVKKAYSFSTSKEAPTVWEIPEKLHDAATDTLFGGGKFLLPFENIDPASLKKVQSDDGKFVGIIIRPKEGKTFTYDYYGQGPDQSVNQVRLGWWDHIQDMTLDRTVNYFQQLAAAMKETDGDK